MTSRSLRRLSLKTTVAAFALLWAAASLAVLSSVSPVTGSRGGVQPAPEQGSLERRPPP